MRVNIVAKGVRKRKLVCGVGINDVKHVPCTNEDQLSSGVVSSIGSNKCIFYRLWAHMLARCYSDKVQKLHPTYIGCSVCEEWLTFSNFKAWVISQDWEGKQMDKDILFPGNKVYCPEACVFVNARTNVFILEGRGKNSAWPIGVSFYKRYGRFMSQCSSVVTGKDTFLGYFDTPEEAHQAWLTFKLEQAKILASEQDDPRVAEALIYRYANYAEVSKLL